MVRTTTYCVLRTTTYYVQRTTMHCVLRTTTYNVLRTTTYCVLRTTTYYVERTTTYCVLRTYERTLLDVRVFNPHAPSNRQPSIASCYRRHEQTKKRAYEQRCREVEHASFTPLVMSATGGLAKEATMFYKRLASMLASKWDHSYSSTLCWLRCRLNFSLLRSSIQALRGSRSSIGHPVKVPVVVDLVNIESRIQSVFTA